MRKALESPLRQIAANAGLEGSVIIDKILASGKTNYGFDAQKEEYVDMIAAGIVDPTKVTRSALENAASVALSLIHIFAGRQCLCAWHKAGWQALARGLPRPIKGR